MLVKVLNVILCEREQGAAKHNYSCCWQSCEVCVIDQAHVQLPPEPANHEQKCKHDTMLPVQQSKAVLRL